MLRLVIPANPNQQVVKAFQIVKAASQQGIILIQLRAAMEMDLSKS